MELVTISKKLGGNAMDGIAYLLQKDSNIVKERIEELTQNCKYDDSFWEETLYNKGKMIISARVVHSSDVVEINTYEQLREFPKKGSCLFLIF